MSKVFNQIITGISFLLCLFSCTWEQLQPQIDCSKKSILIELISSQNVECGESNGSFLVVATGGEGPYTYSTGIDENTEGDFGQLTAGTYKVLATDAVGCNSELEVQIQNSDGVRLESIEVSDADCGSASGTINILATGGQEPYRYTLNSGEAQESNIFTDLNAGNYTVIVEDQSGCTTRQEVNITSGVSFQNNIQSIIVNNCAISGCHNGSVSPNLTTFSTIQSRASTIRARTQNRSMPRGSSLSQTEIDLIACWVEDGALNN